jgi:hypothetical protein
VSKKKDLRMALRSLVGVAENFITESDGFPAAVVICVVCVPEGGGKSTTIVSAAIHPAVKMVSMQAFMESKLAIEARMSQRQKEDL